MWKKILISIASWGLEKLWDRIDLDNDSRLSREELSRAMNTARTYVRQVRENLF